LLDSPSTNHALAASRANPLQPVNPEFLFAPLQCRDQRSTSGLNKISAAWSPLHGSSICPV